MIEYIVARNKTREQIGIIDLFKSVIWERSYYGTGSFEVYAPATEEHLQQLKEGHYITRPGDDEVGIIERIELTYSPKEGRMITASGRFSKSLLDRRLIYKLTGTSNRATILKGNVEAAVRSLVQNNIINATDPARNISFIKLGASAGTAQVIIDDNGNTAEKQVSYQNLLSYTDELLQEYGLGAKMTMDAEKNLLYRVFEGTDKRRGNAQGNGAVIFSQTFDNLVSSQYSKDETERKTTALVGGAGEDISRFYSLYGGNYSGEARREVFVDASSIDKKYTDENETEQEHTDAVYRQMLHTQARQELAQLITEETFAGEVDVTHSQYKYKTDFELGDIVTIMDTQAGLELASRITEIRETQDATGYSVELTFNT